MEQHNPFARRGVPPERFAQATTGSVASAEAAQKREKILRTIAQLRTRPESWVHPKTGETRDETIAKLQDLLDELEVIVVDVPEQGVKEEQSSPSSASVGTDKRGRYINIGNVHVPICEWSQESAQWQATPGKVFVSGGKKFAEVRFVKDAHGLTHTAKPGELMAFSERHRGRRLESVDTVLEGRDELRVFNEGLRLFGELTTAYQNLNPDDMDYDAQAKELARKIDGFTQPEGLQELLNLETARLEDVDDFSERMAEIMRTQQFLRSLDEGGNEFVPPRDPAFKLAPYFEKKIAWFAGLINRQLGLGNNSYMEELVKNKQAPQWEKLSAKGMTVIVGPRGTGKNKLVDFYCTESNRPLFRYACSPDKEERDLTYDVELSDGEVVRIPTRILTAVTTPYACLELDEVNLLKPDVSKFFNSLLDGDRTLFLNDQVIKAAPGVVIVALMNPADYDGVEDLPETIDDRSNIMTMGYPPFREMDPTTNNEIFTHDEALILKEHVGPIKGWSDEQFRRAWEFVINQTGSSIALDITTVTILNDLKNIVGIAHRTRQTVEAYKTRTSTGTTRMERDISLRGSIEAARFYSENHLWNANLSHLPGWETGWNAAQYAIAMTYLPHTDTYRRGRADRDAIKVVLAETI